MALRVEHLSEYSILNGTESALAYYPRIPSQSKSCTSAEREAVSDKGPRGVTKAIVARYEMTHWTRLFLILGLLFLTTTAQPQHTAHSRVWRWNESKTSNADSILQSPPPERTHRSAILSTWPRW